MKLIIEGTVTNTQTQPDSTWSISACSLTADTQFMSDKDCQIYADPTLGDTCYFKKTPQQQQQTQIPSVSKIEQIITNSVGKIISWFGDKVDDTGNWMKDTFTKSDYERAIEDCYKVPFSDEDSAKKAKENDDILDYYKLTDKNGKIIFLGKAWDCENKDTTPPCFKNLKSGKYDPSKKSYVEEFFDDLSDAGVYEYFCNGSVSFKPYYESETDGSFKESGRPKVWYKWDPKTGVINKP
jgi:hypothetical protein